MLLTEEDARATWCPFVRVNDFTSQRTAVNRGIMSDQNRCISSECMAWRFAHPEEPEGVADLGYCGLAGKP